MAPASASAVSPSALSAQEALARLRSDHEAAAEELESHDADAQLADAHEAAAQLADAHDADDQEASLQEALAHEASAFAAEAQLAASNTSEPVPGSLMTNLFSALFAAGGFLSWIDLPAFTSPAPSDMSVAFGRGLAPRSSAPFT